MAQKSYPHEDYNLGAVTELEYASRIGRPMASGLFGVPGDPAPLLLSGGALYVREDTHGLVCGEAWSVDDDNEPVTIATNAAGGAVRLDHVVTRLDWSTMLTRVAVKQGVVGGSLPTLTQQFGTGVFEISLGQASLPAGGTVAAATLTNKAWYLSADGLILCTASTRPPHAAGRQIWQTDLDRRFTSDGDTTWLAESPYECTVATRPPHQEGLLIHETDTGRWYVSVGGAWKTVDVHVCTSTTRPGHSFGRIIWETDKNRGLISTGAAWRLFADEAGAVSLTAGAGWTLQVASVRRRNGLATVRIRALRASGTVSENSQIGVVPADFRPVEAIGEIIGHFWGSVGIRPIVLSLATNGSLTTTVHDPIPAGYTVFTTFSYPYAY